MCRQGAAVWGQEHLACSCSLEGCALGCKYDWPNGMFSVLWNGPGYLQPLLRSQDRTINKRGLALCLPAFTISQLGFPPPDTVSAPFTKVWALAPRLNAIETESLMAQSS
jgi:hypothetical protein